jgi:hypothetical protein
MESSVTVVLSTVDNQIVIRAAPLNAKLNIASVAYGSVDFFRGCPALCAGVLQALAGRKLADCLHKDASLARNFRQG